MVILDAEADEQQIGSVIERITQILSDRGGEVLSVDRWGRRKFAYEIGNRTEGVYLLVTFTGDSEALTELERVLSLADEVVRYKIVRLAA